MFTHTVTIYQYFHKEDIRKYSENGIQTNKSRRYQFIVKIKGKNPHSVASPGEDIHRFPRDFPLLKPLCTTHRKQWN